MRHLLIRIACVHIMHVRSSSPSSLLPDSWRITSSDANPASMDGHQRTSSPIEPNLYPLRILGPGSPCLGSNAEVIGKHIDTDLNPSGLDLAVILYASTLTHDSPCNHPQTSQGEREQPINFPLYLPTAFPRTVHVVCGLSIFLVCLRVSASGWTIALDIFGRRSQEPKIQHSCIPLLFVLASLVVLKELGKARPTAFPSPSPGQLEVDRAYVSRAFVIQFR